VFFFAKNTKMAEIPSQSGFRAKKVLSRGTGTMRVQKLAILVSFYKKINVHVFHVWLICSVFVRVFKNAHQKDVHGIFFEHSMQHDKEQKVFERKHHNKICFQKVRIPSQMLHH